MKTLKTALVLVLLIAMADAALGCQNNRSSASSTATNSTPAAKSTTEWEYKTDVMVGPVDLRKKMQEWKDQGWLVLSVSGPVQQADGKTARKAELKREKQKGTSNTTQWEYKTDEVGPLDDLAQKSQEWSDQGWLVLSITSNKQADGTTIRKAQLRREKK